MTKSQWRKSSTWFALNRKHSLVFVNETKLEKGWELVPCCDEHYLPSLLAYNNMDNETTCTDGFVHVHWDSLSDSHPHTYHTDEIDEKLVSELQRPVSSHVGFNQQCSGNEIVCHFTARKFSGHSRFTLIEKVHLLLDDTIGGVLFSKDRWNEINTKLRLLDDKYYVIEDGLFRGIPDVSTLWLMHLNASYAVKPTDEESKVTLMGPDYPSRKDGQILKARKNNEIFLVQGGKRRSIPDMDTFDHLGLSMKAVLMISETDMMQIPKGKSLPIS
jgi:Core-2/I-Branching enzyme